MKNNPFLSPSWVGACLVAVSLVLLYWAEPLLRERTRSFVVGASSQSVQTAIPVDHGFKIISAGNLKGLNSKNPVNLGDVLKHVRRPDGKILLNFWATWCDPCIEELPSLGALAKQLPTTDDQTLPILVTISVDENSETVRKFESTLPDRLPFLVLHDPDGVFSRQLGINKFPETFLIDSKGKILNKWIGPQDWLSLEILEHLKKSCA